MLKFMNLFIFFPRLRIKSKQIIKIEKKLFEKVSFVDS